MTNDCEVIKSSINFLKWWIKMNVLEKSIVLNDAIESKFKPLNWVDITTYGDGTGSISFTDNGECKENFFNKMVAIKEFIKELGYSAELIYFNADELCPYDEATININFEGGEL